MTPPRPRVHRALRPLLGRVRRADAFAFLPKLPAESVHAVVTDPPFGIGFLGQPWDRISGGAAGYQAWCARWARECLRVLLPGGHLVAFGGNRTVHRLAGGVEDAGFEVRGLLGWVHAQGIPKTKHQLRPALEPIVLARKPFRGPAIGQFARTGTGLLNVEACRIPFADEQDAHAGYWPADHPDKSQGRPWYGWGGAGHWDARGRWPATLLVSEKALGERSRYFNANAWAKRSLPQARFAPKWRGRGRQEHPTVKPLPILAWLVSLVTWPGQVVLDPFAGTGTTLRAAQDLGRQALGTELGRGIPARRHPQPA